MQGLAQVLTKHKSRLQLEKEAAKDAVAAAKPAPSKENQLPSYMRPTAAFRHATSDTSGLGENLVVHRSRLERDRDAAKEAAKLGSPRQVHLASSRLLPTTALPAILPGDHTSGNLVPVHAFWSCQTTCPLMRSVPGFSLLWGWQVHVRHRCARLGSAPLQAFDAGGCFKAGRDIERLGSLWRIEGAQIQAGAGEGGGCPAG